MAAIDRWLDKLTTDRSRTRVMEHVVDRTRETMAVRSHEQLAQQVEALREKEFKERQLYIRGAAPSDEGEAPFATGSA